VGTLTRSVLAAAVAGAGVLAALAGANLGRRDARALAAFPDLGTPGARRVAIVHTGRAVWRAMLGTAGAAAVAVLVARLPPAGLAADWVFPMLPAAVGALAHRAGMLHERLRYASAPVREAVEAARAVDAKRTVDGVGAAAKGGAGALVGGGAALSGGAGPLAGGGPLVAGGAVIAGGGAGPLAGRAVDEVVRAAGDAVRAAGKAARAGGTGRSRLTLNRLGHRRGAGSESRPAPVA
jgi:hypothetical protein